jgi:hypothetical protein
MVRHGTAGSAGVRVEQAWWGGGAAPPGACVGGIHAGKEGWVPVSGQRQINKRV